MVAACISSAREGTSHASWPWHCMLLGWWGSTLLLGWWVSTLLLGWWGSTCLICLQPRSRLDVFLVMALHLTRGGSSPTNLVTGSAMPWPGSSKVCSLAEDRDPPLVRSSAKARKATVKSPPWPATDNASVPPAQLVTCSAMGWKQ